MNAVDDVARTLHRITMPFYRRYHCGFFIP